MLPEICPTVSPPRDLRPAICQTLSRHRATLPEICQSISRPRELPWTPSVAHLAGQKPPPPAPCHLPQLPTALDPLVPQLQLRNALVPAIPLPPRRAARQRAPTPPARNGIAQTSACRNGVSARGELTKLCFAAAACHPPTPLLSIRPCQHETEFPRFMRSKTRFGNERKIVIPPQNPLASFFHPAIKHPMFRPPSAIIRLADFPSRIVVS